MVESERAQQSTDLLSRLNIGSFYLELIHRKTLLFCVATAGLLLGLIVTLVIPPGNAEVRTLIRDSDVGEYSVLIVPNLSTLTLQPMPKISRELASRESLHEDTDEYNASAVSNLFSLTPQQVLDRISRELSSREGLREAVEAVRTQHTNLFTFIPQRMLNEDRLNLKLLRIDASGAPNPKGSIISLSLTGTHPSIGLPILSKFLDHARARIRQAALRDRQTAIELEKKRLSFVIESLRPQEKSEELLQGELHALRDEAKLKRQAEITRLREALSVASSIGLTKPSLPQIAVTNFSSPEPSSKVFENTGFPLFLLGTEGLSEQIKVLENRSSDDQDDVRILEVERDINILRDSKIGQTVNIRGNRVVINSEYTIKFRYLRAIESLQQPPPSDFHLVSVVSSPRIISYNDYAVLVWNMVRGLALGAVLACFVIAAGLVVKATREQAS
jgi:LPS O-antigen subunit length determinant protein (WzzB/FepE family)